MQEKDRHFKELIKYGFPYRGEAPEGFAEKVMHRIALERKFAVADKPVFSRKAIVAMWLLLAAAFALAVFTEGANDNVFDYSRLSEIISQLSGKIISNVSALMPPVFTYINFSIILLFVILEAARILNRKLR